MCGTGLPALDLVEVTFGVNPLRWPPPPTVGPWLDFLLNAGMLLGIGQRERKGTLEVNLYVTSKKTSR